MSRGGRGRGRGGRPNIPGYDYDASLKLDSKPSELFPDDVPDGEQPYRVPVAAIPTEKEKREVAFYLALREQIHKGSLYTAPQTRDAKPAKVYGEDQFNSQFHNRAKPDIDPFEGVPLYSWKYDQQKLALPQLSARPLDRSLFPKELWSTLEGEEGKAVRNTISKGMKKKAEMPTASAKEKGTSSDKFEKIKGVFEADEADAEIDREEDDEDPQEEEKDYDYEEDEDEMGGDYGAEQYFDGGDGDDDDGMDTGGGDVY